MADDRCDLAVNDGILTASSPSSIFGLLEVRGIGIVNLDALASTRVDLAVMLCDSKNVDRMPDDEVIDEYGVTLPLVRIPPFEASAAAKVRMALVRTAV